MSRYLLAALLLVSPLAVRAESAAAQLGKGYRAMSIPLPPHQLTFIDVGDRVDVLCGFQALLATKSKEDVTATILQNVRVLAVDRTGGAVLLEMNPNEAQYAALFTMKDRTLWLTKRSPDDKEMHPMEMASASKLFR